VSFWVLLQVVTDLILVAGVAAVWFKLKRPSPDDPRLSKGLQLLQTKISVIEDLSDRTETQVSQVTALLEGKVKEVQSLLIEAEKMNQKIEASMQKSLEVAKIFQDRIPHQEIVERQNTIKYVKAARMAHQGATAEEIAREVDLSKGEIEFITKVNRNQLQFSEENLPEWARESGNANSSNNSNGANFTSSHTSTSSVLNPQPLAKKEDQVTLSALGDRFRRAIHENPGVTQSMAGALTLNTNQNPVHNTVANVNTPPVPTPAKVQTTPPQNLTFVAQNSKGQEVQVRKVQFPKMNIGSN
jgi:hypothetical protein